MVPVVRMIPMSQIVLDEDLYPKVHTLRIIPLREIMPSPYQHRKSFDPVKLEELARSILQDGLISPILVRLVGPVAHPRKASRSGKRAHVRRTDRHFELIAGERRLRAIREYTDWPTIEAKIIEIDDRGARRISAVENIQREDLTVFETIEAIVALVDAELYDDLGYISMGSNSVERVRTLLGKLDSVRSSQERGSEVSDLSKKLFHRFVEQVDGIFKNLPKPLEWRSFYTHDLNLLVDICDEVQEASIQHDLNKSQIRALAKLNAASEHEFQEIVNPQRSANRALSDFSATEIEAIANKEIQKQVLAEQAESRSMPALSSEVKILLQARLGIPEERIARRLKINQYHCHPW